MYCDVVSCFTCVLSSSGRRKAVISTSSTDAESLSFMIIFSSLYTRNLNRRYSMCCLVENGCILVISVSVFPFPPESSIFYIRMIVVSHVSVSSLCSCVGLSNCLDTSR